MLPEELDMESQVSFLWLRAYLAGNRMCGEARLTRGSHNSEGSETHKAMEHSQARVRGTHLPQSGHSALLVTGAQQ